MSLASKVLNVDSSKMDKFEWAPGSNGKFKVKDVYCLAKAWVEEEEWDGWRRIWRINTQQQARVFVWLLSHGALLTNSERRRRRHLRGNDLCTRCLNIEGSVLHAVRDCSVAVEVWNKVLPDNLMASFFSKEFRIWVLWLLKPGGKQDGEMVIDDGYELLAPMEI